MTELWHLSATELARRVRAREVAAREAAKAALERLEAVNPLINAVIDYRPEWVFEQADKIDAAIARGEDPGPLAGVPVTTKINIDQAGFATTNGTRLQKDLIAQVNSPAVENLVRAGAILLGRTNSPTFALRWFTSNQVHGHTKNPRNASLTPGGSSGGAAAAVTAGIGPIALGTDIGGSVRYPAYACGVHGLRPSIGRVPAFNASSPERPIGAQMMSVAGPDSAHGRGPARGARGACRARPARPLVGAGAAHRARRAAARGALPAPWRHEHHEGGGGRRARRRPPARRRGLDDRTDRRRAALA
ncbi:amidase [Paraburkholderia silvatlantica]|uniref:Amidase n=1 Tax=Paraburkholderia silvatlantica TaxID=321895 RepID=A0ABR6FJC1_9BURK|nr:amidase [Paraburkholderia silvatlantica]